MDNYNYMDGYEVLNTLEGDKGIIINLKPINEMRICPECGSVNCYSKGKKKRFYRDTSYLGRHAEIAILSTRYKCNDCEATFYPNITGIDETFRMTTRLKNIIRKEAICDTFEALAKRYGIDEKTVRRVFDEYRIELQKNWIVLAPEVLGIDECHLAKNARAVFVDVKKENSKLIEMGKDDKKKTIIQIIESMIDLENIKVVTMDMSRGHKSAVEEVLPNAVIVIDKFHVTQTVIKAAVESYKKVREKMEQDFEALPEEEMIEKARRFKNLKIHVNMVKKNLETLSELQRGCIKDLAILYPAYAKVIIIKENFRQIMNNSSTRNEAETKYDKWKDSIPDDYEFRPFIDAAKTIDRWHKEIFNYFDHPETNGPVEALNGLAKISNRAGRGYTFDVIRAKLLFETVVPKTPKYSRPQEKPKSFGYITNLEKVDFGLSEKPKLIEGSGVNILELYEALKREFQQE